MLHTTSSSTLTTTPFLRVLVVPKYTDFYGERDIITVHESMYDVKNADDVITFTDEETVSLSSLLDPS